MEYEDFRREYLAGGLTRDMLDKQPIEQFERWLEQAVVGGLADPTAMSLGTVDAQGRPWQRLVLLKGVSEKGFVFYTNHGSDKAAAIAGNPRVSLLFPWNALDRQVIVGGVVEKMSMAASARYYDPATREPVGCLGVAPESKHFGTRAA